MNARSYLGSLMVVVAPLCRPAHAQWIEMNSSVRAHDDLAVQVHDEGTGESTLWAVVLHDEWASTHRRSGTDPWTRYATDVHDGAWTRVWMPPIGWSPEPARVLVARSAGGAWVRDLSRGEQLDFLGGDGEHFVSAGMTGAFPSSWDWIVTGVAGDSGPEGGLVRVWRRTGHDDWELSQTLSAPEGAAGNAFGRSIAIDGQLLAIGARDAAHLYVLRAETWALEGSVLGAAGEDLGCSVALRSTLVAPRLCVGAPLAGPAAEGRIDVHELGAGLPLLQAVEGRAPGGGLGSRMEGVGGILNVPVNGTVGELQVYLYDAGGLLVLDRVFDSPALGASFPQLFDAATGLFLTSSTMAGDSPRSFVHEFRTVTAGPESSYYAFCDQGAPCGNEDPIGGCRNAAGEGARLHLLSDTSAGNFFLPSWKVSGRRLPPGAVHTLFVGTFPKSLPFGDGILGVGGQGLRFPVQLADEDGATLIPLDQAPLPALPCYMQLWYRDPGGPCGSGFNLSNAVEVRR